MSVVAGLLAGVPVATVAATSVPGATILLAEPKGHVKRAEFDAELEAGSEAGFQVMGHPQIAGAQTALLRKG
jgi:hypothetical protein